MSRRRSPSARAGRRARRRHGTDRDPDRDGRRARDRRRLLGRDARGLRAARARGRRRRPARPAARRPAPAAGGRARPARRRARSVRYLHLATTRSGSRRSTRRARCCSRAAGSIFDVFAPSRGGHRGDERPLDRARAGDRRARGLGSRDADADAVGARRARRVDDDAVRGSSRERWHALLAEAGFDVDRVLRLVRPAAVRRRRGQRSGSRAEVELRKLRQFRVARPLDLRARAALPSPLQRARSATRSKPRPSGSTKRGQPRGGRPVGRGGRKRNRLAEILWSGQASVRSNSVQAAPDASCQAPAPLVQRDRSGHRDVERLAADCGIDACTSQRSSTSGGSPRARRRGRRRSSPSSSSSGSGVPPCGTSAMRVPAGSSNSDERHAEERAHRRTQRLRAGRVGAARARARRPRRTHPPSGAASRRFPDPRRATARASPAARRAAGRRAGRRRSRAADARASTPPRAAPARRPRRRRGDRPARPAAASTRSSPSATNSPSLSRQRRSWSLRTSLSRSLSREVIRPERSTLRALLWPARRSRRTRPGR